MHRLGYFFCFLLLCGACVSPRHSAVGLSADAQQRFDYLFLEAHRCKQADDYVTAYERFKQCLSIDPNAAAVLSELAYLNLSLNQSALALQQMERAVALEPDNYWYKSMLALFYHHKGMTERAIATYEEIVTQFPKRTDDLMTLIDLYHSTRLYEKENIVLDRLERLEGASEQIALRKVGNHLELGETEKAFAEVERLVEAYPNDLHYKVLLADTYVLHGHAEEALPLIEEALAEEPDNAEAQWTLATYYRQMDMDSLYAAQNEVLLMNRKFDTEKRIQIMRREIIEQQQRGADSTRVMNLFERLIAQEEETTEMSMLCAQYMFAAKMEPEKVKPVLRHILAIEPDNASARMQLLIYAMDERDPQTAIEICLPALQYNPEEMAFYFYLGISYYQQEQTEEAFEVFQKGIAQ